MNGEAEDGQAGNRSECPAAQLVAAGDAATAMRELDFKLRRAILLGQIGEVDRLLAAGANVNARGEVGETPLHRAAANGHVEVAQRLVSAGAGLDTLDAVGDTPLHDAAMRGHADVARYLITAGAGLAIKNRDGRTPEDAARIYGLPGVADLLRPAARRQAAAKQAPPGPRVSSARRRRTL